MTPSLGWVAQLLSGTSSETHLGGTQDQACYQVSEKVLLRSQAGTHWSGGMVTAQVPVQGPEILA